MSHLAAYVGPARPIADALKAQTDAATQGATGGGVVWWPADEELPLRCVTSSDPAVDANLASLAPRLSGQTIIASIRTPGKGKMPAAASPFELDGVAGMHEGFMGRFREVTAARCIATLPEELVGAIDVLDESKAIFLLAIAARREDPDLSLADALVGAVGTAARICADAAAYCSLNVVLARRDEIVGLRFARGVEPTELWYRGTGETAPGLWLANSPMDDEDGWEVLPADHLVRVTSEGATVRPVRIER
ncbi:MAG: hypothetical protein GKS06_07730 [Acidobacteria bacterium]|nr:hypothetical protein [Acidobacteriota bacterium]